MSSTNSQAEVYSRRSSIVARILPLAFVGLCLCTGCVAVFDDTGTVGRRGHSYATLD